MREIGLASGEPPAQRGFPPSMFDSMPKLLERSGTSDKGSITGLYTVLVDGDDMDEPVADTVRGILDGHIVLSRDLAQGYHYPAIDVLQSISRLAPHVSGEYSRKAAGIIRKNMAFYARAEDLINVGAYHSGSNPEIDEAIEKHIPIEDFLIQDVDEPSPLEETLERISMITGVKIPHEEMKGSNAKLVYTGRSAAKDRTEKETVKSSAEDTERAINSVAALFSSMPGMGSL
jgi:flagellum-specific ATP synthase